MGIERITFFFPYLIDKECSIKGGFYSVVNRKWDENSLLKARMISREQFERFDAEQVIFIPFIHLPLY